MNMTEFVIPIHILFELTNAKSIEYEQPVDISNLEIEIKTPTGWAKINALVKKYTDASKFFFDSGDVLVCANDHLVFQDGECKYIKSCSTVDTITGKIGVSGTEYIGKTELFDVSINYPHKYITENGIIHHNTTIAFILIKALGIHKYDLLKINASRENSVDDMRNKITNFIGTMPFGDMKIVLLDEADFLSPGAQGILRGLMEEYALTSRFILTCNYVHKIIPPVKGRCQCLHIDKLDLTSFTTRIAEILIAENIEFDLDTIDTYVKATYPDLRKCINTCQLNCIDKKLTVGESENIDANDYKIAAVNLFKQGKFREARTLICSQIRPDEIDSLITWTYQNLDLFADTEEKKDEAILVIRKAAVNASLVCDPEVNVAALFVELAGIK
jgi:DNA polymerase III delta prime subunit